MGPRISLGLALGLAVLTALPLAQPAQAQENIDVCSRLTPAEAGSLVGDVVVTPRSTTTVELSDLAGTIAATPASPTAPPAPPPAADKAARPIAGGACSYLAGVGGATGLPPSQVQLTIDRFQNATAAEQAFAGARKALRLMRPAGAAVDPAGDMDEGSRTYSAETTAISVKGDTLVLLSVIDFAVLIRGKPNPAVMEHARLLARRVAGM